MNDSLGQNKPEAIPPMKKIHHSELRQETLTVMLRPLGQIRLSESMKMLSG